MKRFLVASLVLSSVSAMAAERNIFDLMYLPNAGTKYGITDVNYLNGKASGDQLDIKLAGVIVEQNVGYSFTDRLSLQVGMNYTTSTQKIDYSTLINNNGTSDTTNAQRGFSDPSAQLKFRILEEAVTLDVIGGYTVKTGTSSVGGRGNNLQGGNSSTLGLQVGQKMTNMQWSFLAGFDRNYQATTRSQADGKTRDDAHNQWSFVGNMLNRLSEKSFINSSIGAQFTDKYDDNQDSSTAPTTEYKVTAEYQHLCSQNLLMRAGLGYHTTNQAGLDDFYFWTVNAGATYQF